MGEEMMEWTDWLKMLFAIGVMSLTIFVAFDYMFGLYRK